MNFHKTVAYRLRFALLNNEHLSKLGYTLTSFQPLIRNLEYKLTMTLHIAILKSKHTYLVNISDSEAQEAALTKWETTEGW